MCLAMGAVFRIATIAGVLHKNGGGAHPCSKTTTTTTLKQEY